ncbi:unnamed protein product [Vitrella brassicaformis CCMP3155]|uniref:Uncharacterized protein n=1 Tax=Vitrella brassicaformis (strain CCMP3155) TaxID=1169540 RepID=A0A0G4E975_VITBC|nr:unnamed protein product [Vitrella brassicaformis CCMP3155]|eukprot:CEL91895.1 unnamed protein product [Vitrella brassicaformis CCMP3155]
MLGHYSSQRSPSPIKKAPTSYSSAAPTPFFPKDANTLPVTTTFQFKYWPDADPLRSVQNPTRSTGNEHGAVREQADNEDSDE